MKASIIPRNTAMGEVTSPSHLDRMARKVFLRRLSELQYGQFTIRDDLGESRFGRVSESCPFDVEVHVHDVRFYRHLVLDGHLGAAETYMRHYWTCPDVASLIRLMLRNQRFLSRLDRGLARFSQPIRFIAHRLRSNTRSGSRRNIVSHYDIGNDFYRLMLDSSMTYSCGIFEQDDSTLLDASTAKNDRLCRKLALSPADHLLEIGSGWGGFAIHAARHYGCRVTTTTISKQQFEWAKDRIEKEGLSDRITILREDYRDLQGQYDKLVSIEMIEAVGHEYYETFFRKCCELLRPDGMMAIQTITIPDHLFRRHVQSVDFIRRYIFPGSCIPTISALGNAMAGASDLRIVHLDDITPHYARTLRSWYDNVRANIDEIRSLGYSDTFLRLWEFYLLYCEGSFAEGYNRDVQLVLVRPECRVDPDRFAGASAAGRPAEGRYAMKRKVVNFALFQAGWFACILSATSVREWIGSLVVVLVLALHLTLIERSRTELAFLVVAGLLGTLLDSLQAVLGTIEFAGTRPLGILCPIWITALWFSFSTTINVCLGWLQGRYVLAAILGAVAGPFTYAGAARLGAVTLPDFPLAMAAVAAEYAIAIPLLLLASRWLRQSPADRTGKDQQTGAFCGPES